MLLDIMMPKLDGIATMTKLREVSNVPVILLTAKSEDTDKILGLNVGADDYVTKPFNPVEVLAWVKSQLRRYLQLGGRRGEAHPPPGRGHRPGRPHQVRHPGWGTCLPHPREYEILRLLLQHLAPSFPPSGSTAPCGEEPYGVENAVAVHIRHLREKLEINPSDPPLHQSGLGPGVQTGRRKAMKLFSALSEKPKVRALARWCAWWGWPSAWSAGSR